MPAQKYTGLWWIEEFVSGTKATANRPQDQIGKCLKMKDFQQRTLLIQNDYLGGVNDYSASVNASWAGVNEYSGVGNASFGAVSEYAGGVNEFVAGRNESVGMVNAFLPAVNAFMNRVNASLHLQNDFFGARHRFAAVMTLSRCGAGIF